MLIYKEFFKNTKMGKKLLKISFVKLLIFCLLSKVIQCNTECSLKEEYLPWISYTERVTIFTSNFWKLIMNCDSWWVNTRPVTASILQKKAPRIINFVQCNILKFFSIINVECCIFVNNCFNKDSLSISTKHFELVSAKNSI